MDEEDYKHALSGSSDLAGCVLKGADFKGMNLSGRDFRNAKLDGANFQQANLEGADFRGATNNHAIFLGASLKRSHFDGGNVKVDFREANLSDSRLEGVYLSVDFRGANLSGANLTNVRFNEDCLFDGAIVSEGTLFDGAQVLRPYSRLPPFRFYRFERGMLHRILPSDLADNQDLLRLEAIDALTNGIQEIRQIPVSPTEAASAGGIGHNNPPEEFQLTAEELEKTVADFAEARDALNSHDHDPSRYHRAIASAKEVARKATIWSGQKVDLTVSEFAKEFGKTLGGKAALVVAALHITGALERIVNTLTRFIESLL